MIIIDYHILFCDYCISIHHIDKLSESYAAIISID